jgi:hypothetical protein
VAQEVTTAGQEVTTAGQEAALEVASATSALPATTPVGEGPTAGALALEGTADNAGANVPPLTVAEGAPITDGADLEANATDDHTTLETLYIRRTIKGRQRYLPVVGADLDRVRADGGTLYRQVGSGKARRYFPINGAGAIND